MNYILGVGLDTDAIDHVDMAFLDGENLGGCALVNGNHLVD